uniref:Uncharacterized protein n=1 Tax=Cacopsylla melanoneura TaxID=428564 RepID=A0A8D8RQ37_9HEMI
MTYEASLWGKVRLSLYISCPFSIAFRVSFNVVVYPSFSVSISTLPTVFNKNIIVIILLLKQENSSSGAVVTERFIIMVVVIIFHEKILLCRVCPGPVNECLITLNSDVNFP